MSASTPAAVHPLAPLASFARFARPVCSTPSPRGSVAAVRGRPVAGCARTNGPPPVGVSLAPPPPGAAPALMRPLHPSTAPVRRPACSTPKREPAMPAPHRAASGARIGRAVRPAPGVPGSVAQGGPLLRSGSARCWPPHLPRLLLATGLGCRKRAGAAPGGGGHSAHRRHRGSQTAGILPADTHPRPLPLRRRVRRLGRGDGGSGYAGGPARPLSPYARQ